MEEVLDGILFRDMVLNGASNLKANSEYVNNLNVFPVPDGDTGTNMCMTIENGAKAIAGSSNVEIGKVSKELSRGMLFGARGNSGVILSQIFGGIYKGLENKKAVNAMELAEAYKSGVAQSYKAVKTPVEGTILTVFREATEYASSMINENSSIEEFYNYHFEQAKISLQKTKEILPVLTEADVIDSGACGYTYIVEGMLKKLRGEELTVSTYETEQKATTDDKEAFNADTELTYGYCTEFLLQLQNSKVDITTFDEKVISDYLATIGDSIVCLKDEDVVKVHVHTKDPGLVLLMGRKYGEFRTIKIENMQLQHNELEQAKESKAKEEKKSYKTAVVAVCQGEGLTECFKSLGCAYVIQGGQTMNPSTEDFIKAFDSFDAENIIVLPNNKNIIMAANQACQMYDKAKCYLVDTKTLAEGYSALTMLDVDNNTCEEAVNEMRMAKENVVTSLVTYSIRDTDIDGIHINKGDYIALCDDSIIACSKDREEAALESLNNISEIEYKEVLTIIYGAGVSEDEVNSLMSKIQEKHPNLEIGLLDGGQDIYSFIFSLE